MTDQANPLAQALAERYTIERELGSGGMATVYLAEDVKHHRKVAVKVLRPELAAVLGAEGPLTSKELQRATEELFERAELLGEVGCPEASNRVNFASSVDLLVRRGILAEVTAIEGTREKREARYVRGPSFDELPVLHERLAAALAAR